MGTTPCRLMLRGSTYMTYHDPPMMSDSDLRSAIKNRLKSVLTVEEETHLKVTGEWDDALLHGEEVGVADVAATVLQWREHRQSVELERMRHPDGTSRGKRSKPSERSAAVTALLADEAGRRADVRVFRDSYLSSGLLPSHDAALRWWDSNSEVEYPRATDDLATWAPPDPPAMKALMLATTLAEEFNWTRAGALVFILTGAPPSQTSSEFEVKVSQAGHPATHRVILSVDPALPPERVQQLYRAARKQLRPRSQRALSARRVALAKFVANRPNSTWEARRTEWDRTHRRWRYGAQNLANFKRDARVAKKHLLNQQEGQGLH